jgi:hypothetical protein
MRFKTFEKEKYSHNFPEKLASVKKILLVVPLNSDFKTYDSIHKFKLNLNKIYPRVKISTFERVTLQKKDCDKFGMPADIFMQNFKNEKFDMVVDLSLEPDSLSAYFSAFCGAPIRINLTKGNYDHIYNLHFNSEAQLAMEAKLNHMIHQIKMFVT